MIEALVIEVSFTAEKNRMLLAPNATPAGAATRRDRHDRRRRKATARATA